MDLSMFTNLNGRIGRQQWWLGVIALMVVEWIIIFVLTMLFGQPMPVDGAGEFGYSSSLSPVGSIIVIIILLPFIWFFICLYAKRWHDRGKSGWWTLIGLVPVIGLIWIIVELGILKGTEGPNQYGPDPLA
ncbi:MAG TPA: DUF805 domain-containing protein [Aestuariivirga sp.]|nr:DUF805 domain-containing protein [Aestuariivirga sp.]